MRPRLEVAKLLSRFSGEMRVLITPILIRNNNYLDTNVRIGKLRNELIKSISEALTNIHDVIFIRIVKKPIIEESQLGISRGSG